MIGDTISKSSRVVGKQKTILKIGYCEAWFSKPNNFFYKEVVLSITFKRNVTLRAY